MPSLIDFVKLLWRGPADAPEEPETVPVERKPSGVPPQSTREPEEAARTGPRASAPSARRTQSASRRPTKIKPPRPLESSSATAGTPTRATPEIDLESLLRRSPSLDRVRSRRSEDPESRANDGYQLLEALRDKVGG